MGGVEWGEVDGCVLRDSGPDEICPLIHVLFHQQEDVGVAEPADSTLDGEDGRQKHERHGERGRQGLEPNAVQGPLQSPGPGPHNQRDRDSQARRTQKVGGIPAQERGEEGDRD
jgi:hypothetical protein